jgi:hypothetical protein
MKRGCAPGGSGARGLRKSSPHSSRHRAATGPGVHSVAPQRLYREIVASDRDIRGCRRLGALIAILPVYGLPNLGPDAPASPRRLHRRPHSGCGSPRSKRIEMLGRPEPTALSTTPTPTFAQHFVVVLEDLLAAPALASVVVDLHHVFAIAQRIDPRMEGQQDPTSSRYSRKRVGVSPLCDLSRR